MSAAPPPPIASSSAPVLVLLDDEPTFHVYIRRVLSRFRVQVSVVGAETSSEYRRLLHELAAGRAPVVTIMTDFNHAEFDGVEDHAFAAAIPRDVAPGGIQLRAVPRLMASGGLEHGRRQVEAMGGRCLDKPFAFATLLSILHEGVHALGRAVRSDLRRTSADAFVAGEVCFGRRSVVQDSLRNVDRVAAELQAAQAEIGR